MPAFSVTKITYPCAQLAHFRFLVCPMPGLCLSFAHTRPNDGLLLHGGIRHLNIRVRRTAVECSLLHPRQHETHLQWWSTDRTTPPPPKPPPPPSRATWSPTAVLTLIEGISAKACVLSSPTLRFSLSLCCVRARHVGVHVHTINMPQVLMSEWGHIMSHLGLVPKGHPLDLANASLGESVAFSLFLSLPAGCSESNDGWV